MGDVALRRIDRDKNMARYYFVAIERTLFGDWAVVRRWGRIGSQRRSAETWFSDPSPALACTDRHKTAKRSRGDRGATC